MLTAQRFQNKGTGLATEFSASFAIGPAPPVEVPFANTFSAPSICFYPSAQEKSGLPERGRKSGPAI